MDVLLLGTGVAGLQLIGGELWISDMFTGVALTVSERAPTLVSASRART